MTSLIQENKLGEAKGTPLEEAAEANFQGETGEVGLYLAMARIAQQEGFPEVGEVLKTIGFEEAQHAARYALLNGKVSSSTKTNLQTMLAGEQGANRGKREAAIKAKTEASDEVHEVFDESSRDEGRHANMLQGLLQRYFK